MSKILFVRGVRVMIDSDLAELYGVSTRRLNEQIKRNAKRFPEDFMFRLTELEKQEVVANCDHLKQLKFSPHLPHVFTEHGAVMLAGVLNSERSISVNIRIVRVFNRMRQIFEVHSDILRKIEQLQEKDIEHDEQILLIFEYLKKLEQSEQNQEDQTNRKLIGFKRYKDEK